MAPKAEKKPAQPAKKAVAKKSSAGRKKGSKKAVESYKIYIYKVRCTVIEGCSRLYSACNHFRLRTTFVKYLAAYKFALMYRS